MESKVILIVDDEEINLEFFDIMLSKLGFRVEKAKDGQEALEKIKETIPDLVLLDNIMPKLSGWEVTRILKTDPDYAAYSNIPIVMFSAMDDVRDKIEGFELGVEDYITKPFNFSEVLSRINSVLKHQEMSAQLIQRQRRLAVLESLNKSFSFFASHIKEPLEKIDSKIDNINIEDKNEVNGFLAEVKELSRMMLASLEGLEEEIDELSRQDSNLKNAELTLDELEAKYQKHFKLWKEREAVKEER
ncbi:response regulator [Spirochaetia bacterium 38H-sp]|uniref:Response regulator n=1 Tax=Rarispira pelagica TaxID=3141764 RepID=A0ABU9UAA0_9SPIR